MSLTSKLKSTAKYGGYGLAAAAPIGLYHASKNNILPTSLDGIVNSIFGTEAITKGATGIYSNYFLPGATKLATAAKSAGGALSEVVMNTTMGLHKLYAGAATAGYSTVSSLLGTTGAAGMYSMLGATAAGLTGVLIYAGLTYLTYRGAKFLGKKTFKLADYVLTAPFKGIKKLIKKIVN